LPEAQLDRFILRINIGYPSPTEEVAVMERQQYVHPIDQIEHVVDSDDILMLQQTVKKIHLSDAVKQYIISLVDATRHHPSIYLGASPRGSLALSRTSQARALLQGRDYVIPDDIKALAVPALAHRALLSPVGQSQAKESSTFIDEILNTVPVPQAIPG
jgi:MoxR-like ATPase